MKLDIKKKSAKFDAYLLFLTNRYIHNKYLDILMPIITSLGNLGIVWISIAIVLLCQSSYRMIGELVLVTLIISTIIGEGLIKHMVRRTRPCNVENEIKLLISKPTSYSFPSGHTVSSFAVAEVLSVYFTKYKLIFIAIAFLIALSRLYLYVHYPTDILVGIILGLLCSKLVLNFSQAGYLQEFIMAYKGISLKSITYCLNFKFNLVAYILIRD